MRKLLLLFACALMACGPTGPLDYSHSFPDNEWAAPDTLETRFEITEAGTRYDLSLGLQLNDDYPFQNIYLKSLLFTPTGDTSEALFELQLNDAYGYWNAERSWLGTYSFKGTIGQGLALPAGGYTLQLVQYTRRDTLPGLEGLSLQLLPASTMVTDTLQQGPAIGTDSLQ